MSSDNILVAVKCRPFINREKKAKLKRQWLVQEREKIIFQIDDEGHRIGEPYAFDHIFSETCINEDVYNTVVKPLIRSCLEGFNSTIFTYGQTSSGKTHTMMGNSTTVGITQLAIQDIFRHLDEHKEREFLITCSYYEIYKEKIKDLLDKNGQNIKIREDVCGTTYVPSKQEVVTRMGQVLDLMRVGNKIKKMGCTQMNEKSSRSHTIFRINIESRQSDLQDGPVQMSQLNLVDLAGSERIAHTNAAGIHLDEGININKSLSALGNVIRQLSDGEGFISYRDSKLTRLLQQALGGNAKSLIIATVTLAVGEETKSTLEFAQRAKIIKNKPIVNEILTKQDKIKQYEFLTSDYKDRLETEIKRIQIIQQERDEKEIEILKLKNSIKIINTFAQGTPQDKPQTKIPRRHTVGHYYSGRHLPSDPEASSMPHTSTDRDSDRDIAEQLNSLFEDDEESDEEGSGDSHNISDTIVEAVADEPSFATERVRLRHLEESYASLQEFTRLEAECKDKELVESLQKEKEALVKDLKDYNTIIIEERKESQDMKMLHEAEIQSLRTELERQKAINVDHVGEIITTKAELDMFKHMKDEETQSFMFVVDGQKKRYEEKITELRNANTELRNELKDEERKWWQDLQQELNVCKANNVELKEESEKKIRELEIQLESARMQLVQEEANLMVERRAKKELEDELKQLKNKYVYVERENTELQATVEIWKQTVFLKQTKNSELLTEIENKEIKRRDLVSSVEKLTTENSQLKLVIERNTGEKIALENKMSEQQNNIQQLTEINESLRAKSLHLETRNSKISKKLGICKTQYEEALKQHLLTQKDVEQKNVHINKLKDEIKILTNERDDIQMKFDRLDFEKKDLEREIVMLEHDILTLNDTIEKLKEYNGKLTFSLTEQKEKIGNIELNNLIGDLHQSYKRFEDAGKRMSIEEQGGSGRASTSMHVNENPEAVRHRKRQLLDKVSTLTAENIKWKDELDILKKDVAFENSILVARVMEIENVIQEFTRRVELVQGLVSVSTYELSLKMSPKEARRRKRRSLHDQRRGIDADSTEGGNVERAHRKEEELKVYELYASLGRLDAEVRHLISIHSDEELRRLKQEVQDLKSKIEHCPECKLKNIQITHLESLQQSNVFKIVELETKYYDLQNAHQIETEQLIEQNEHVQRRRSLLEKEIEAKTSISKNDLEVQCDLIREVWQTEETENLKQQVIALTSGSISLERAVHEYMDELDDYRKHNKEQENDIKKLKEEIKRLKMQEIKCRLCDVKQKRIEDLEDHQRKSTFKLVNMQTTIYDLKTSKESEKNHFEFRIQELELHIKGLEKRVQQQQTIETKTVGVECDILDHEQTLAKYQYMKKLALVRRAEGNKLRALLGMLPDEPVD